MAKEITASNFDDQVSQGTSIVDFWAPWCGPCRAQAPILDQLDPTEVTIYKLNVDENPQISTRFNIVSIPTLIVFKDGKETKRVSGLQNLNQLKALYKPL